VISALRKEIGKRRCKMNRTEILQIAKPILFNTEMVQAILEDRKTRTRRPVKESVMETWDSRFWNCIRSSKYAPYQVGDVLYVRETMYFDDVDQSFYYKADYADREIKDLFVDLDLKATPSIHMSKEYARIFLKVTDVSVEKLKDITELDAEKEGIKLIGTNMSQVMHRFEYFRLWDKIYGNTANRQKNNPWVWVYEFQKVEVQDDTNS
jgi:uncharacterized protein YqfB (UPF0267 family)